MSKSTFAIIESALAHMQIVSSRLQNEMREALLKGDRPWVEAIAYEDSRRCFACDQEAAFEDILLWAEDAKIDLDGGWLLPWKSDQEPGVSYPRPWETMESRAKAGLY